ncbi:MAG: hypothetical protein ABI882_07805 [Acidobacteriota bacterium]
MSKDKRVEKNQPNTINSQETIEGLRAPGEEINGDSERIFVEGVSAAEADLGDLEANSDVKGGREHILLARQVGL